MTDLSPQDRNIAMVFQFPVLYDMTVLDNLMFPLLNKKMPKKAARETARQIAEILGLTPVVQMRSKDIDMGARQRVTLGRALVRKPSAFLMDEPLSSIEPEGKWHLKMQIKEIQHTLEQTLIYVTHDQSEALTLADKIVVMNKGKLLQYSSVDNIYNSPASTFVGYFIGDPGMNFMTCTLGRPYPELWKLYLRSVQRRTLMDMERISKSVSGLNMLRSAETKRKTGFPQT